MSPSPQRLSGLLLRKTPSRLLLCWLLSRHWRSGFLTLITLGWKDFIEPFIRNQPDAEPSFNLDAGSLRPRAWLESALRPSVAGLHAPMIGVILLVSLTGLFR